MQSSKQLQNLLLLLELLLLHVDSVNATCQHDVSMCMLTANNAYQLSFSARSFAIVVCRDAGVSNVPPDEMSPNDHIQFTTSS